MFRIGIVGLSGFAANHWRGLEEVQRAGACQIVAATVIDPENHGAALEALRGRGVVLFGSAAAMFAEMRGRMEAVTLPTPIHTHAALAIAALQSGYHVFLEKPPCATIQEHDEMLAAIRRSGRLCAVGFQDMWSQSIALLKLRLAEGQFGEIHRLTCAGGWIRREEYYRQTNWRGHLRIGDNWVLDGTANNPMAHQIQSMLYLASPEHRRLATPTAIRAELYAAHEITGEDTCAMHIRAEGPEILFLGTLCADEQFDPEITLLGEKAIAHRSFGGQVSIRYADGRVEKPVADDAGRSEVEKFENFIAAASAGDLDMLRCHLEMCRPFTLAVNGAYESAGRIRRIGGDFLRIEGRASGRKTIIEGIDAAIPQAASQGKLFSDLDLPWAAATEPYDLAGYNHFPVRFAGGEEGEAAREGEVPFA
jgi:predicted dehydrogenase